MNLFQHIVQEAVAKGTDPRPELQKVRPKAIKSAEGGSEFVESPYDMEAIDNLIEVDSYVQRVLERKQDLVWKEGYDLKGANPEAVKYIKQRFDLLGLAMNEPIEQTLSRVTHDLITYNNAFIVKTRDIRPQQLTGMKYQGMNGGDPVAGYSTAAVSTMSIKTDDYNRVKKYKQSAAGNEKTFKVEDVIHFGYNVETGNVWGKPFLTQAIEDVRSFRIIEEDILNLIHKEIYPLYMYLIGDELRQPDQEDINRATNALEQLREVGGMAMPGKDKIEVVGAGNKTTGFDSSIAHFKERVIVGQGVAPYQIGLESSMNKSTAERMDAALYDQIKSYQRTVEGAINSQIIFELLLEGGFDPLGLTTDISDAVMFEFKEIDVTSQIARENHIGHMFVENQIKHGEQREMLGLEVDPETADLYFYEMVSIPLAEAGGMDEGGSNPNSPNKGASGSKDQPSNQYKKKGAPKTVASEYDEDDEEDEE